MVLMVLGGTVGGHAVACDWELGRGFDAVHGSEACETVTPEYDRAPQGVLRASVERRISGQREAFAVRHGQSQSRLSESQCLKRVDCDRRKDLSSR